MGINHYAITSDGAKHGNPKYYRKHEVKLTKKQKQLTRKQKGSNNGNKARIKVAKVHNKITRCREDFLHKLSRKLVDENQVIVGENLARTGVVYRDIQGQSPILQIVAVWWRNNLSPTLHNFLEVVRNTTVEFQINI